MNAAVYARKSTEQTVTEDAKSVTRQVELARAFATKRGWAVVDTDVYSDDGISGAEFEDRPGLTALLLATKSTPRPFDVLVTMDQDRIGRDQVRTLMVLNDLVEAGVEVFFYATGQKLAFDSPTDQLMVSIRNFGNQWYRHQVRAKTREAMRAKAARGHVAGGKVFGYTNVREGAHVRRVVNETEAAVVLRIFELCMTGLGFRRIAMQLNAERAPAPEPRSDRVAGWAASSVREVLYRDAYAGRTIYGKTRWQDKGGTKVKVDTSPAEWVVVEQPELRLIPEDLWQAVHARLGATRQQYLRWSSGKLLGRPSSGVLSDYLLTGLGVCGMCGGSLTVRTKGRGQGRSTYECLTHANRGAVVCANALKMDRQDAEAAVRELFAEHVLRPDVMIEVIEGAVARLRPSLQAQDARRVELTRELTQLESQVAKLTEAIALGGSMEGLVGAVKDRERRRAQLRAELAELEQLDRVADLDVAMLARDLEKLLADWRGWMEGHNRQARQILRKLVLGRLTFTPKTEDGAVFYEFAGVGALEPVLAGVLPPRVKQWCPRGDSNTRHAV